VKGTILDRDSFDRNDISLTPLVNSPVQWEFHGSTAPENTIERINSCEIVVTNKVAMDSAILESASSLKLILVAATGTDNIDLHSCAARNIVVCNVRHYATPAVAQHTLGLIINLLTSQFNYRENVRDGRWSESNIFCLLDHPIIELEGKILGIVGYGNLGRKVADLARAFGMQIMIWQRPNGENAGEKAEERYTLDQILIDADIISLHCPLTPQTHHLLGAEEFKVMKNSAIIINTARGAIIDTAALATALQEREILGAGIDVLEQEPPPENHILLQSGIPNLIVTPHNAWASRESRQRLVDQLGSNLNAWLSGDSVNTV